MDAIVEKYGIVGVILVMAAAWLRIEASKYKASKNGNGVGNRTLLESMTKYSTESHLRDQEIHSCVRQTARATETLVEETREQTRSIDKLCNTLEKNGR